MGSLEIKITMTARGLLYPNPKPFPPVSQGKLCLVWCYKTRGPDPEYMETIKSPSISASEEEAKMGWVYMFDDVLNLWCKSKWVDAGNHMNESQSTLLILFLSQTFNGWRTVFSEEVIQWLWDFIVQELRTGKIWEGEGDIGPGHGVIPFQSSYWSALLSSEPLGANSSPSTTLWEPIHRGQQESKICFRWLFLPILPS